MMMFALFRRSFVVMLFGLGACAGPERLIPQDQLSQVKTVGLLSAIGDGFRMSEIGFMVFQNRVADTAVPEWRIDGEAVSIATRVLESKGAYQVVPIVTDRRAEIESAHRPAGSGALNLEVIQAALRSARVDKSVDAYIVIGKVRAREPCDHRNAFTVEGIGICAGARVQMAPLPGETEPRDAEGPYGNRVVMPFAFYRVSVFRGSDLAPLGSRSAAIPGQKVGPLPPGEIPPAKRIHSSAYKEEFKQFSEDDKRVIRKTISELLEASLPHTLMGLGLVAQ